MPKAGDTLPLDRRRRLAEADSGRTTRRRTNDAAGKVVIHWFCTPKVAACTDDLARIVTLRERRRLHRRVHQRLAARREEARSDPRERRRRRGTVATGPGVKKLFKQLGIAKGPASIVVDVDGKVKLVTTSGDINELDARDTMVKALVDAIKPFTTRERRPEDGEAEREVRRSRSRSQLANWLTFSKKTPMEFTFTVAEGRQVRRDDAQGRPAQDRRQTLTATVTCTAPQGQLPGARRDSLRLRQPERTTGLGNDGATWKFEVK